MATSSSLLNMPTPPHILDVDFTAGSTAQTLPLDQILLFPPFPPVPPTKSLQPFRTFKQKGVYLGKGTQQLSHQLISSEDDTIALSLVSLDNGSQPNVGGPSSKKGTISIADAWKIGEEAANWQERASSRLHAYDLSTPPFTRLMTATRDFLTTRHEAFMFAHTKRLFDLFRNAVGLRVHFEGPHWPASGHEAGQRDISNVSLGPDPTERTTTEEVCVLLLEPVKSVRGFLALARKEAEAGWDFEPALKLAKMVAAFLTYLEHCEVLPELDLSRSFASAAALARSAPPCLLAAKQLEHATTDRQTWNRASWSAFGGSYGQAERGGMEREIQSWATSRQVLEPDGEDGGWTVDEVIDSRPEPLSPDQALPFLQPLLAPIQTAQVRLLHHIPYSRRRITSIHPPAATASPLPRFMQLLWRVSTAPAPWTPEERWKPRRQRFDDEQSDDDDDEIDHNIEPLEREEATLAEPDELSIWVEADGIDERLPDRYVGQALRGRWAMMGTSQQSLPNGANQWWTFKAKDFVLPAFWQSRDIQC